MRMLSAVIVCTLMIVLGAQTGSAVPLVRLVSPALAINANQRLECTVVNTDDSAHQVTIKFYDSNGTVVSGNPPQLVASKGSAGLSFPPGFGANHCEITTEGRAEWYRASIDVIDTTALVQPAVVIALPIW